MDAQGLGEAGTTTGTGLSPSDTTSALATGGDDLCLCAESARPRSFATAGGRVADNGGAADLEVGHVKHGLSPER